MNTHPSESFLCDLCHDEKEELNQREDIVTPTTQREGRCSFICDECLEESF